MGNIIPESNTVGIINISPEPSIAATCVLAIDDMSIPKESATNINSKEVVISQNKLPAMGTSNTNTDNRRIVIRFMKESTK